MASYTEIDDSEFDPGKPGKSSLFKALNGNLEGVTEGVTGAPRIKPAAIKTVLAGTSTIFAFVDGTEVTVANGSSITYKYMTLLPCEINVLVEHTEASGGSNSHCDVYVDGVQYAAFDESTGSYTQEQVTLTCGVNSVVTIRFTTGNQSGNPKHRNVKIRGSSSSYIVGVPIYGVRDNIS